MRSSIDAAGRVVIPKQLRERLGLRPGTQIEIRDRDGCIEIEPVAVDKDKLPPLTGDLVRETLERTRR